MAAGHGGGVKAHYDCIGVFSETDTTEDLKKIDIPVLVLHSKDDQIVPIAAAGPMAAKLLKKATLKVYEDLPHGMPTTHADIINADLLAFFEGTAAQASAQALAIARPSLLREGRADRSSGQPGAEAQLPQHAFREPKGSRFHLTRRAGETPARRSRLRANLAAPRAPAKLVLARRWACALDERCAWRAPRPSFNLRTRIRQAAYPLLRRCGTRCFSSSSC
ncbi:MAG: alpha/beta hydrolase [Candidatus Acidiferrales bacterium]